METSDSIALAALIVAVVATLTSIVSVVLAWLSRRDALRAGNRAQVAADTAARSTERIAQIQSRIFDGPPWEIRWWHGDTFLVTNQSPVEALAVEVSAAPEGIHLQLEDENKMPFDLGAKSAFTFMFSPTMDDPSRREIVLHWFRPGSDERLFWQHPIPVRPRH